MSVTIDKLWKKFGLKIINNMKILLLDTHGNGIKVFEQRLMMQHEGILKIYHYT